MNHHRMKCGHFGDCIITDIADGNQRIDVAGCSQCWDNGNKNSIHIDTDYNEIGKKAADKVRELIEAGRGKRLEPYKDGIIGLVTILSLIGWVYIFVKLTIWFFKL